MSAVSSLFFSSMDINYVKEKIKNENLLQAAKNLGIDTQKIEEENRCYDGDSVYKQLTSYKNMNKTLMDELSFSNEDVLSHMLSENKGLKRIKNWLASDNKCTDGKDDGKISIFSKVGNFLEGAIKTVVGTVYDIVTSPKKMAITVLTAAALTILAMTPIGAVVIPILGICGALKLAKSGIHAIKNAHEMSKNATTDEEAKDACEKAGEGGAKIAAGAYVGYNSTMSLISVNNTSIEAAAEANTAEFENVVSSEEGMFNFVTKSVFDPGNIEAGKE